MKINGIIICILLKISLDSVVKASFQNLEAQDLPLDRPVGTISINSNGLNSNEIHIAKRNLPVNKDGRVLGRVCDEECSLLPHIEPGQKVIFKNLEK